MKMKTEIAFWTPNGRKTCTSVHMALRCLSGAIAENPDRLYLITEDVFVVDGHPECEKCSGGRALYQTRVLLEYKQGEWKEQFKL